MFGVRPGNDENKYEENGRHREGRQNDRRVTEQHHGERPQHQTVDEEKSLGVRAAANGFAERPADDGNAEKDIGDHCFLRLI